VKFNPVNYILSKNTTVEKQQKPFPDTLRFEQILEDHLKISHLSRDGKVIYAVRLGSVLQSVDEGETWDNITVGNPSGQNAFAVRELDDGELLITTRRNAGASIKSKVFKTETEQ